MFEFAPVLMLLACVGVFSVERVAGSWRQPAARHATRLPWIAAAIASCGFAIIFSLQVNGFFAERNPPGSAAVARVLNRVPALVESAMGVKHGPWEMDIVLPATPRARAETLLTLGDPPHVNRVFVRYGQAGKTQLGFARGAMPPVESAPLALEPARPHRLRVFLGGFWPAPQHPWFADVTGEQRRHALRLVRVELDGQPVVQAYRRFDDVAGARVRVGAQALGDARQPRFSGEVRNARRIAMAAGDIARLHERQPLHVSGDVFSLRLKFPRNRVGGPREPLVVSGSTGRGDVLGVEYLDETHLRFIFDHWGSAPLVSEPIAIDPSVPHELVVRLPWLAAPADAEPERRGNLQVAVDGILVWQREVVGYTAEPEEIAVGENPIGGNHPDVKFTGEILGARRSGAN